MKMRSIEYSRFLDKVHGCWYGKCLGGAAGAPVEGLKKLLDVNDFEEIFNPDLPNDDLDMQLLWLDVLEEKGTIITSCDLADAWVKKCWYPFSEYGYFLKNYMRGVKPPYSGIINNSFFKEGMGCPIRSEIWGIIAAGNSKLATEYAYLDGTLDHADNSVWAEQFLAAAEAEAFFENDVPTLLKKAIAFIPVDSKLKKAIELVFDCCGHGLEWKAVRQEVLNKYSHPDFTNVVQNLAFVVLALLYGHGDMRTTINISLKCGYDADCTCASAASIVGIVKGYENIGDTKGLINDYYVCGIDVHRRSDSIKDLAEDTAKIALLTPNFETKFAGAPAVDGIRPNKSLKLEYVTENGMKEALKTIKPMKWEIYGPYFEQLNEPMNPNYPSPHGEGSALPDIVCMVNNEVFLNKEYIADLSKEQPAYGINAYEDFIEVDNVITMDGQMCCYARTTVESPEDRKVWLIVGNNDGFRLWVNGENVLEKDEIRLWTPYNNYTLVQLHKGTNEIVIKLLRRTEHLKFSIGLRQYDGNHWHRSKWVVD